MNEAIYTTDLITAEQAVFTSVRSPTGEGYRVIASSPGVRGDEKAEITRRCPSHGALCNEGPGAIGLLAYPLGSGRYCVGMSFSAGEEHTGRGGCRVYTHLAILDPRTTARFECNPVWMHAALHQAVGGTPCLVPQLRLDPLVWSMLPSKSGLLFHVPHPTAGLFDEERPAQDLRSKLDMAMHLSLSLIRGERVLLTGASDEYGLLQKTLLAMPMKIRRSLAVSVGIRYSPARQLHLCFAAADHAEAQKAVRGQRMRWLDGAKAPPPSITGYESWARVVRRWMESGRETEIERVTTALTGDISPANLDRIANLCADIDALEEADAVRVQDLVAKYARYSPNGEAETNLLRQFRLLAEKQGQGGAWSTSVRITTGASRASTPPSRFSR